MKLLRVDFKESVVCETLSVERRLNMDSNSNVEQKNRKNRLRLILGVFVSLLFVLSVDMLLWAIGSLNTTMSVIIATFVSLLVVLSVGVILWNGGIFGGKK